MGIVKTSEVGPNEGVNLNLTSGPGGYVYVNGQIITGSGSVIIGPQGDPGATGSVGETGATGATGPKGDTGDQGIPGIDAAIAPAGLTWSGTWSGTQSYLRNHVVGFASASWWSKNNIAGRPFPLSPNLAPNIDTTNWALLATQGPVGPQGRTVTPSTLISTDADNALTVGTDSKLFVAESTGTLPYQELIFTAVQTAPQTGITSGTLIEGGRYTITNCDITADFVISGAADNEIGTIFIANATPPDWGVLGELSFEGNPIVTILNNPLSDTYTSHYTSPGSYYLEGLLDFPVDTFPKLGAVDDYVDNVVRSQSDGTGLTYKSYLWHKDNFNDKRILIKTMTGGGYDLEDDQLNGTQLFIVKIFNL